MNEMFRKFSISSSSVLGSALSFMLASVLIVLWLLSGPFFKFSDTWQLYMNTFTSIVTFLMIFLVQNTQNRSDKAVQLKLNELILKLDVAENRFVAVENATDNDLRSLEDEIKREAEGK